MAPIDANLKVYKRCFFTILIVAKKQAVLTNVKYRQTQRNGQAAGYRRNLANLLKHL